MPEKFNSKTKAKSEAEVIQVLEGLEAVRLRPGMYIGTTGEKGLHHILWEIVDNAMDEAANGFADSVDIVLYPDGSASVADNGRGIPVDKHPKYGKSGVELVFTMLHAGGKFDNDTYKFSGGLHGVGASVTNALSKWLVVEVYKNKKVYRQEYTSETINGKHRCGIPTAPLKEMGATKLRGTKVSFLPDADMFGKETFNYQTIKKRIRELAFLNKGIKLSLEDRRSEDENGQFKKAEYVFKGGLRDFVKYVNEAKEKQSEKIVYIDGKADNYEIEIAMQYTTNYGETIISYVNNIPTTEGGTHETGFKTALTRSMNEYVKRNNLLKKDMSLVGEDFRDGLTAILSVRLQNVQFEGQTKTKLGNPEVKSLVESVVYDKLDAFFKESKNKDIAQLIFKIATNSSKVRDAEKRAKDAQRHKNSLTSGVLVGKFSACSGRDVSKNELFIVEGDSAGGSTKQGRDRSFQAVLPLRGKPLNAEKKRKEQIIQNEEIKTIIYALGTDYDKDFNLKNLKFNKVIILADADQDGAHIRAILLTFFYRYMKELIVNGNVYIGMPPLYKIEKKGVIKYAYDDAALDEIVKDWKTGYGIQRYKGLGEMNPEQLWETTLNPKTRTLLRVTVEDAAEADLMISTLMGDNVEARKAFINENANFNKTDAFAEKFGG